MKIINSHFVFSDEENSAIKELKENTTNFVQYLQDYCELVAKFGLIVKFNKIPHELEICSSKYYKTIKFIDTLCYKGDIDGNISCEDWVSKEGNFNNLSGWDLWENRNGNHNEIIFIVETGSGSGGSNFNGNNYVIPLFQFPKIYNKLDIQLLENKKVLQYKFNEEISTIQKRFDDLRNGMFNNLWETNMKLTSMQTIKADLETQLRLISKLIEFKRVNIQKIANKSIADTYNIDLQDINIDIIDVNALFKFNNKLNEYKQYNIDELFADDEKNNLLPTETKAMEDIKLESIKLANKFMQEHPYLLI